MKAKDKLFLGSIFCAIVVLVSTSYAFVAYEVSPGTVELRSRKDRGLIVTNAQTRNVGSSKTKLVYFCVSEVAAQGRTSNQEKCFYGANREFRNVKPNQKFASI